MAWWKSNNGYVNSDSTKQLVAYQVSNGYLIQADGVSLNTNLYATITDANEAIRKLVDGVDPSTIV